MILFRFVFDKFDIKVDYVVYRYHPSCGVIIQIKLHVHWQYLPVVTTVSHRVWKIFFNWPFFIKNLTKTPILDKTFGAGRVAGGSLAPHVTATRTHTPYRNIINRQGMTLWMFLDVLDPKFFAKKKKTN